MTILIDPPRWPAHGRLWSHLISDVGLDELHAFARAQGIPERGFEGDHYDVPQERYEALVAAGARPVDGRTMVRALQRNGTRLRKRKGERGIARVNGVHLPDGTIADIDLVLSDRPANASRTLAALVFLDDGAGHLAAVHSRRRDQWGSPGGWREPGESVIDTAIREVHEETGLTLTPADLRPVGYEVFRAGHARGPLWRPDQDTLQVFAASTSRPMPPLAPQGQDVSAAQWLTWSQYAERCGNQFWFPLAEAVLRPAGTIRG